MAFNPTEIQKDLATWLGVIAALTLIARRVMGEIIDAIEAIATKAISTTKKLKASWKGGGAVASRKKIETVLARNKNPSRE